MNDVLQSVKTDLSEPDIFMAVFPGAFNIFTVVNMKDFYPIDADDFIKLVKNTVKIISDIIPGVMGVASVKADG